MAPLLVQPSGDMSAKIYKELCEDPSAVPDKMKHVIEWLEMQPHLPPFKGASLIIQLPRCILLIYQYCVYRRAAHQNFPARLQVQQRKDQEEIGHVFLHEGCRA